MLFRATQPLAQAIKGFLVALALAVAAASPGYAQRPAENPFGPLAGSWSGTGTIALSSGTKERIRCRATYRPDSSAMNLQIELRCASDSYTFELKSNVSHKVGEISGMWTESTRGAIGSISGIATGNQIQVRALGPIFSAILSLTTRGDRQQISIQSPGSEMSEVLISLSKAKASSAPAN